MKTKAKKKIKRFKVEIIESEVGWGAKIDSVRKFATKRGAENFVARYNKKFNSEPIVPSWYMYAKLS